MGKHKDKDKEPVTGGSDYDPKHAGPQDAWDWAQWSNATADTQKLPKVDDKGKDKK